MNNYLLIDDFYNPEELKLIEEEILALKPYGLESKLVGGVPNKKTGKGIFLDGMFAQNRTVSKILNANRKVFTEDVYEKAIKLNVFFGHLRNANHDSTLLNYYGNDEEYKPHVDFSTLTAISFFKIGNFTGGDFCFLECNEVIKFKHNRLVIFPSCMEHQALSIKTKDDSCRVSISQFIGYLQN